MTAFHRCLALAFAFAFASGCHDVTDPRSEDRVESLSIPKTGTADGTSIITVTAVLREGTPLDQRTVTFTTTAGQFLLAGKTDATATVTADANRVATVQLRAPSEPATAIVTAAAAGGTRSDSIQFARRPNRLTQLDAPESAVADGSTLLDVVATLATDTPADQRTVTFATTAGQFVVAGTPSATTTVTANSQGKATVLLRSPADATRALVSATAAGITLTQTVMFTARQSASERVRDLVSPDTGTADGASLTEVVAILAADTPPDQRTVSFTTTAGQLISGGTTAAAVTATAGTDLRAVVLLRAPADTARAIVAATAGASVRTRVITYRRAQPESVQLVPSKFALTTGPANELIFTATVRRANGTPSPGVRVLFTAVDSTETRALHGQFTSAAPTEASGAVTVRFTMGADPYLGPLLVRAVTLTPAQVSDTVTIRVIR